MKKKKLKFIIKTQRMLSADEKEKLQQEINKFLNSESDVFVVPQVGTITVLDENNKYLFSI